MFEKFKKKTPVFIPKIENSTKEYMPADVKIRAI